MAHVVKVAVGPYGKPYEVRWSAYRSATERVHRRQRFRTEREAKAKKREIEQAIADAALPNEAGRREEFTALAERWFRAVAIDAKLFCATTLVTPARRREAGGRSPAAV